MNSYYKYIRILLSYI